MSRLPAGYDHWVLSGDRHTCLCGRAWHDSDYGPCHQACAACGEATAVEDLDALGRCPRCTSVRCAGCKGSYIPEELNTEGLCQGCEDERLTKTATPQEV